ncbi:hypothetical protein IIA95_00385 [Patescibacteria group bacterium]|nr:hypothetical protein [Patescibacteria group bacterium]
MIHPRISNGIHPRLENHARNSQLAHGYLLIGEVDYDRLARWICEIGGEVEMYRHEVRIVDVRKIKEKAYTGVLARKRKCFIINADLLGHWASTALLKILEEPPAGRHFFLVASSADMLPDTIRSRLIELYLGEPEHSYDLKPFLDSSLPVRGRMLEEAGKDSLNFNHFLNQLESWARKNKYKRDLLARIQTVRRVSRSLGIGRKMCLEYLNAFI